MSKRVSEALKDWEYAQVWASYSRNVRMHQAVIDAAESEAQDRCLALRHAVIMEGANTPVEELR